MKKTHGLTEFVMLASALTSSTALAEGSRFELNLTTDNSTLQLFSENRNDGYSVGRGIIFIADEPITINGAELWAKSTTGLNATFELWEIINTKGEEILDGATLVRSASDLLMGDIGFHGLKFDEITLSVTQNYLLRVLYDEAADENWLFDFDQTADPPLDLGPVTVIDGITRENTGAFAAPFMALQIVPAPGVLALLGLAAIGIRRRTR